MQIHNHNMHLPYLHSWSVAIGMHVICTSQRWYGVFRKFQLQEVHHANDKSSWDCWWFLASTLFAFGLFEQHFQGNLRSKTICLALLDLVKRIHCNSRRHHGSRRKGHKYFVPTQRRLRVRLVDWIVRHQHQKWSIMQQKTYMVINHATSVTETILIYNNYCVRLQNPKLLTPRKYQKTDL